MGFCSNCGTQWVETQTFCSKCGKTLPQKRSASDDSSSEDSNSNNVPIHVGEQKSEYTSSTGSSGFVTPDEVMIYSLKNGVALNLISGEGWKKEDAIITNKRLYYNDKTGILSIFRREEIVDLDDISGSKILEIKPIGLIVFAIVEVIVSLLFKPFLDNIDIIGVGIGGFSVFLAFLFATVLVVMYFVLKRSFLQIEYAGGSIRFSVKKYGLDKVRVFQRQIYAIRKENE